jgi:hypothetical protein
MAVGGYSPRPSSKTRNLLKLKGECGLKSTGNRAVGRSVSSRPGMTADGRNLKCGIDSGINVDNRVETAESATVGRRAKMHVPDEACKTPDGPSAIRMMDPVSQTDSRVGQAPESEMRRTEFDTVS